MGLTCSTPNNIATTLCHVLFHRRSPLPFFSQQLKPAPTFFIPPPPAFCQVRRYSTSCPSLQILCIKFLLQQQQQQQQNDMIKRLPKGITTLIWQVICEYGLWNSTSTVIKHNGNGNVVVSNGGDDQCIKMNIVGMERAELHIGISMNSNNNNSNSDTDDDDGNGKSYKNDYNSNYSSLGKRSLTKRSGNGLVMERMRMLLEKCKLKILKIHWGLIYVNDQVMSVIGDMKELKVLEITRCLRISEKGLGYLANLNRLRELKLEGLTNVKSVVKGLKGLTKCLKKLRLLKMHALNDEGFGYTGDEDNWPVDDDNDNGGADNDDGDSGGVLGKLRMLEWLDLSYSFRITMRTVKHIGQLTNLTYLNLTSTSLEPVGLFDMLKNLKHLEKLILTNSFHTLSDRQLPELPQLPNLHTLDLSHTPVTNNFLSSMTTKFPSLSNLNLSCTFVTTSITHILPQHLISLDVSHTTTCALHLPQTIEHLNLTSTPITTQTLTNLPSTLQTLNLSHTSLAPQETLQNLPHLPNLTSLILSPTHPSHPATLLSTLIHYPKLQSLSLTSTALQKSAENTWLTYLKHTLKSLTLSGTESTDELFESIQECYNLTELNISQNIMISDYGILKLGGLKSLKWLNCGYTKVTENGLNFIVQCGIIRLIGIAGLRINRLMIEKWRRLGVILVGVR